MPDEQPTPDFFYEVTRHQLDVQLDFLDALDNKLGLLFAVGSAEAGIIAAFLALRPEMVRGQWPLLMLGALSYFTLALTSVVGLWSRPWQVGPDPVHLAQLYLEGQSDDDVKRAASHILAEQLYMNRPQFDLKVWRLRIALVVVAAQTIAALAAVLLEAT